MHVFSHKRELFTFFRLFVIIGRCIVNYNVEVTCSVMERSWVMKHCDEGPLGKSETHGNLQCVREPSAIPRGTEIFARATRYPNYFWKPELVIRASLYASTHFLSKSSPGRLFFYSRDCLWSEVISSFDSVWLPLYRCVRAVLLAASTIERRNLL